MERQAHLRAREIPLIKKCERVISHVWSVAVTGQMNRAWTQENTKAMREDKIMRMTFRPERKEDEGWVTCRKRTTRTMGIFLEKMKLPHFFERVARKLPKAASWAMHEGDVPLLKLVEVLKWRSTGWWYRQAEMMTREPTNSTKWKHMWGVHN